MKWSLEKLELPLKFTWKLSRSADDIKTNLLIRLKTSQGEFLGEVAPNRRYQESCESIEEEWRTLELPKEEHLANFLEKVGTLPVANSLKAGLEQVLVSYLADKEGKSVHEYLGVPHCATKTSAFSIPVLGLDELKSFIDEYDLKRFSRLKVKLNDENPAEIVKRIYQTHPVPLWLDPNEGFSSPNKFEAFLKEAGDIEIEIIEQPFSAAHNEWNREFKNSGKFKLLADESCENDPDWDELKDCFDGVNIKLMKSGGIFSALKQIKQARNHQMAVMLGSMVETTLGVSQTLMLSVLSDYSDLDSFLYLKKDPFELLKEESGVIKVLS